MKINSIYIFIFGTIIVAFSCKKEEPKGSLGGSVNVIVDSTEIDSIPPTIYLIGDNPIESPYGDNYIDPGAFGEDLVDGDISSNIIITGIPDGSMAGKYLIEYNVSDLAGNAADSVTRNVSISYTGEQMTGTYEVVEICDGMTYNYNFVIDPSGNSMFEIVFINFADVFNDPVYATINGDEINIPIQIPIDGTIFTVEGDGTITNNGGIKIITIEFTVTTDDGSTTCNLIATLL
jgi:hypothetical protein